MARNTLPSRFLTHRTVSEDGKVFHLYNEDSGDADTLEPYVGVCFVGKPLVGCDQTTFTQIKSALSMHVPVGGIIQFALFSHPDIRSAVDRYIDDKDPTLGFAHKLALHHAELFAGGADDPLVAQSDVMACEHRLIITIKFPCGRVMQDEDVRAVSVYAKRFMDALSASHINLTQLNTGGFLRLMRHISDVFGTPSDQVDQTLQMRDQIYFPTAGVTARESNILEMNSGEYFAKAISMKETPKTFNLSKMFLMTGDPGGMINQMTDPFYLVTTIIFLDQTNAKDRIRSKSMMATQQAQGVLLKLNPKLGVKRDQFDLLVRDMESNALVSFNTTLFLFSRDRERVERLSANITSYFSGFGITVVEDSRVLVPLWFTCLPLNTTPISTKDLFRYHTRAINHVACFLPILSEWTGSQSSGAMLFQTRHGQYATFNLFDKSVQNYNFWISASSGSGKSSFALGMIRDYVARNAKCFVIDKGDSYKKLCASLRGQYIEFAENSDVCLNPYTLIEDIEDDIEVLKAAIGKMAAPIEGLDDFQTALIEQAIRGVYETLGNAGSPRAVAAFLREQPEPEAKRLAQQMYAFTDGAYAKWFNGVNNVDFTNDLVVLELKDLGDRKALKQVVLLVLMARIATEVNHNNPPRQKLVLIDESSDELNDKQMAPAIEALYRRIRKGDGSMGIVVQGIKDLYSSPCASVILANSDWNFILKQSGASIDEAIKAELLPMDSYAIYSLRGVHVMPGQYSEVMIRCKESWGIFRNLQDRYTQATFSTTGEAFKPLMERLDAGEDPDHVIESFLEAHPEF